MKGITVRRLPFRTVILDKVMFEHNYSEVVGLLKLHFINELIALGMKPLEATTYVFQHIDYQDSLICEVFDKILEKAGSRGIPVTFEKQQLAKAS